MGRARASAFRAKLRSGTVYRLQVVHRFKGDLPEQFAFSTERNSGGFYLDNDSGGPDVGGEYLLFLVPNPRRRWDQRWSGTPFR